MANKPLVSGAAPSAIGGAPYGDLAEVSGPPTVSLVPDTYREFLATDARSILCVLHPHHYNFILNPAMRVNSAGWTVTGSAAKPGANFQVEATTDAAANSAAMVNVRAVGADGQAVTINETVDKPTLAGAYSRWEAGSATPIVYNRLTANQASVETDTAGFVVDQACTLSRSTAQFAHGVASLALTATSTATMSVLTSIGLNAVPVIAGETYTATASIRGSTSGRSTTIAIAWYNSAGTYLSKITSTPQNDFVNTFTTATDTRTAPAGAAFAAVNVNVTSPIAGEVHYVDKVGLWRGVGGDWRMPGLAIPNVTLDRLPDLTGNGRDLLFGAAAAAPVIQPWTGNDYFSAYTGVLNANYIDGITPNVPATATMTWDIETGSTMSGGNFILMHAGANNGEVQVFITSAGAFYVNTKVAAVVKSAFWSGVVAVNTRRTYRVDLTTTGAELFIDGVSQTVKAFGATRVPAANTTSTMMMADSIATPSRYRIYSFDLYRAMVFNLAEVDSTYTTINNVDGSQGGTWTIRRAATGYKSAVVNEPLLLFGGAQTAQSAVMAGLPVGSYTIALRHYSDTATNSLMKTEVAAVNGLQIQILSTGKYTIKVGGGSWTSASPVPAGQHTVGITHDGSNTKVFLDGAYQASFAGIGAFLKDLMFLGSTTLSAMHFRGAALWNKVLSEDDMLKVSKELSGVAPFEPEQTQNTYVLATGQTILKANVPFPVTGDLVGYRAWDAATESLDSTAWVGQSYYLSGDGSIEFNDPKPPGIYGVYVGVSKDILGDDFYEPGRNSAQWTFSAYVKGPAKVRLVMEAYEPVDPLIAYSPPKYAGTPTVADARVAPFDANKPTVIDAVTGHVWKLKDPPYWISIGRPPRITGPATYVPLEVPETYILDAATADIWKIKDPRPASAPYYAKVGTYVDRVPPWTASIAAPDVPYVRYVDATDLANNLIVLEAQTPANRPGLTYYEDTGSEAYLGYVRGEEINVLAGDWKRVLISTNVRYGESQENSFMGCAWIDARLEFRDADGARFSAFMLDPTEYPVAQYFDGSMTEDTIVDDFLWGRDTKKYPGDVNNSVSEYYYDRLARVRFLSEHLRDHVPAGRPYQLFMGSYDDPYTPPEAGATTRGLNLRRKI